jgi:glycosyltransferase involved in cell wall biosynthesis
LAGPGYGSGVTPSPRSAQAGPARCRRAGGSGQPDVDDRAGATFARRQRHRPTKNERQNLPRLIASLPPDVELIICDASDDGTADEALALRPMNTQVVEAPGTIAAARQLGAELSQSGLLVFSDADVVFAPDYFERLAEQYDRQPIDAICGPKLSRDGYARYYRLVAAAQRVTSTLFGIAGASGSNMVISRAAFCRLGGFRLDLRCNEDTELFLRAGRLGMAVAYDDGLVVWATDHRRLRRGLVWKSVHSLVRNTLLYLVCKRPRLPRLLEKDWGYWDTAGPRPARTDVA